MLLWFYKFESCIRIWGFMVYLGVHAIHFSRDSGAEGLGLRLRVCSPGASMHNSRGQPPAPTNPSTPTLDHRVP